MGQDSRSYRKKSPRSSRHSASPPRYKSERRRRSRGRDRSRSRERRRSRSRDRRERSRSRDRRERSRSHGRDRSRRSRSRGHERRRSRDRRRRSRSNDGHRGRSKSRDRHNKSKERSRSKSKEPDTKECPMPSESPEKEVEDETVRFDKEEEQKKLENDMKNRRDRIEKWRAERKAKLFSETKDNLTREIKHFDVKKWSLEDEDEEEETTQDTQVTVFTVTTTNGLQVKIPKPERMVVDEEEKKEEKKVEMDITEENKDEQVTAVEEGQGEGGVQDVNAVSTKEEEEGEKTDTPTLPPPAPPSSLSSSTEEVVVEDEEEDELDPLDAYMAQLSSDKTLIKPVKVTKQTGVTTIKSGVKKKRKAKGELMLSNNDAMEYSSEEEANAEFDEALAKLNRKKKDFIQVDHDKIYYRAFRKDFYIEIPEITIMTPEEVELLRIDLEGIKVRGKGCPRPIRTWAQCGVNSKIMNSLRRAKFTTPTPIQAQAIPTIMSGRDVIGIAKTGSGKTLAFILPMLRHVLDQPPIEDGDGFIAIILTPTRELAIQITKDAKKFTKSLNIKITCVYGGTGISDQIAELKAGTEIIVCTPGRMIDMLSANNGRVTNLRRCSYVVLDEADRMFDMGFEPQVMKILNNIRPDRQVVMFSATFPRQMEALARRILDKPIEVQVGGRSVVCSDVIQKVMVIAEENKLFKLLELLGEFQSKGSIIIFVDKQENADEVMKELLKHQYPCMSLHGGIDQYDRDSTINDFKKGDIRLLVATSVCARGLDVKSLILVVNYDCPNHYEDYVHRCGRTGRAGNKGNAYTFVTQEQYRYAGDIIKALDLSGAEKCEPLIQLWDNYVAQAASEGKKVKLSSGGGFKGKGFKFDESETARANEKKKLQKASLGFEDSDEEVDSSVTRNTQMDINGTNIDKHIEDMFSSVKRVHNISSGAAGAAPGGGVSATTTHTPLATASTRKLEVARKLAAKITVTASAKPSDQVLDINQQTAAAMFNNGATGVGIAGPGVSPAMTAALAAAAAIPTNQSKSIAEQMAMKIHAKLGYSRPDEQDTEEVEEEFQYVDITMLKRYEEELEINDFPQTARWKVTSKEALAQISEFSEAGITVRGIYILPNKEPKDGERRLYLAIEAISERSIGKAKSEITRLIKEELIRLATTYQPVNKARYKVV